MNERRDSKVYTVKNRWYVLLLLFVSRLGNGFQFQSFVSVSDQVSMEIGFSNTEIGFLIGIFMLPGVFLAFPSGWVGRWINDKYIVAVGLLFLCLGGFMVSFSQDFVYMSFGRFVCGAGFVLSTLYFTKMTVDWFQDKELATALGILIISWPGGIALSQLVHPQIASHFGWQAAIIVASVFCLGAAFLISIFYRSPSQSSSERNAVRQESYLSRAEWLKTSVASWSWSFYNAGYLVFLSFCVQALQEYGVTEFDAENTAGISSIFVMVSILFGGIIADKFQIAHSITLSSSAVATFTLLFLPFGYFPIVLCFVFGAIGMASGGIIIALSGRAMAPERRAYGMGVYQTWFFLISAPAPLAAGWLHDLTETASAAMMLGGLLLAMSCIFYFSFLKINKEA